MNPYLLLVAGVIPAGFCWAELVYRVCLYRRYGAQPFLNHVADGYFGVMYVTAAIATLVLAAASIQAIRSRRVLCAALCLGATGMTVAFAAVLFLMNRLDMLVTYSEFAKNLGP